MPEGFGLVDRTLRRLRRAWREVPRVAFPGRAEALRPDLPDDDLVRLREQLSACLRGTGGEVSARARAAELGRSYIGLSAAGRLRFLRLLAGEFATDRAAIDQAVRAWRGAVTDDGYRAAEAELRRALVAPRLRLLTQFNDLPGGVKFLVDLRAELLGHHGDAALAALEDDLRGLLASWFDAGFLDLQRITWAAPAALLEKLIAYEAVHEIRSWQDLKDRLDRDRRCYAFFHPSMPHEPLIFVEVALVNGLADRITTLLDDSAPVSDTEQADTAIFYSISNCQRGLAGVNFGSLLIKRVVDDLARELPAIRVFATLSPMPRFRAWIDERLERDDTPLLAPSDVRTIEELAGGAYGPQALRALLDRPDWHRDGAVAAALRPVVMRLGAVYLLEAKRAKGGHAARDRVAHFHLSNGARIERLNWLANPTPAGLRQSAGLMVNYRYRLADIEANHESYRGAGHIAARKSVRQLLRPSRSGVP
ncbi:MAG: malonyl-CoA decarboxylase [Alphaproteobacteria bacterium]|nr:malonyl-CoA decarboxylase [Alphaproteobacteria bacterium]